MQHSYKKFNVKLRLQNGGVWTSVTRYSSLASNIRTIYTEYRHSPMPLSNIKSSRPKQNGRHFADNISKLILFNNLGQLF